MSIIKWGSFMDPFEEMDKLFGEGVGAVGKHSFVPAVDVYQEKNNLIAEMTLAGVDPEKVDISIENDVLTVKGETEQKSEVDDKNYYRKEIRSGSFYRSVPLPAHVAGEKASAVFDEGVLKVSVPIIEDTKPKTIKVKNISKKKK